MADVNQGTGSSTSDGTSIFQAVVCEVIYDSGYFNQEKKAELVDFWNIKNSSELEAAPLNSCVVRVYGQGGEKSEAALVAYPMFPPHIAMPVKPGECVWVFSPNLSNPDPQQMFWMCRISGAAIADDVNYSHVPRGFGDNVSAEEMRTSDKAAAAEATPPSPGGGSPILGRAQFPNKSRTGKDLLTPATGSQLGSTENPFEKIAKNSESYKQLVLEPVPQYSKRPGDLVLQGSNNTLISLGQDRGWKFDDKSSDIAESETSNAFVVPEAFSGTVDIVAGRSRYFPTEPMGYDQEGDDFERTNFRLQENARDFIEVLKGPISKNIAPNNAFGDPDLVVDASRLMVSMRTSGDKNFGISTDSERIPTGFEAKIADVDEAAYVIAKSDEIRIIARNQKEKEQYETAEQPEINGSIRIVKEGAKNEDLAAICLLPDGTIQISGSKIFLGRATDDDGVGGGPGPGDSQPYVKYQELEDLLNQILDNIDAFCDTLNTHVTPGYGAPSPQILQAAATLKSDVATRKSEIANIKSDRIFGE